MSANKSVVKALKILELISKHQEGITLSEIYKEYATKQPKGK